MNAFDNAKFYDCRDPETLTYESPEEAVERFLDYWLNPGCDVEAVIREKCTPLTVDAYNPKEISDDQREAWVLGIEAYLEEQFGEEFGDPDGAPYLDHAKDHRLALRAWVYEVIAGEHVWACEKVAERTYTADEVVAMMREERPDWFEEEVEETP